MQYNKKIFKENSYNYTLSQKNKKGANLNGETLICFFRCICILQSFVDKRSSCHGS